MARIWAATAAAHFDLAHVETYDGGTDVSAFHPHAIAAMRRAGFVIDEVEPGDNPRYSVSAGPGVPTLRAFSKRFDAHDNPRHDFAAIMTCSEADEACPLVLGATLRVALPHDDPKLADGTPDEQRHYDERAREIAREMLFLFARVRPR